MANKNIKEVEGGETTTLTDTDGLEIDSGSASKWIQIVNASIEFFKRINSLTQDSAPDRISDYLVSFDTSASTAKKLSIKDSGAYVLEAQFASTSPADATTYFFGPFFSAVMGTTSGNHRVYIPRAGVITRVDLFMSGTAGSSETSTISVRLNDTTDTTITSILNLSTFPVYVTNAISITVAAGDWVNIKWLTPTWVTNPTGIVGSVKLFIT